MGTALPPLVEVRDPFRFGGRFDTVTQKFVGDCEIWQCWLIGEKQFDILFGKGTQHTLLYSAEGAGKTVLMSMWVWVQIITAAMAGIGGSLGATAPTATRLETFITGVCDLAPISSSRADVPGAWGVLRLDAGEIQTCSNHLIQFKSTKRQSMATGSPLQGYNFGLGCGMDELQDSLDAFSDVVARLRAGANAPIMATATAKDSPAWRNFRDSLSENWSIKRLSYLDTPFVHDSHWRMMLTELTEREADRRMHAKDVGPERMVYSQWERARNLRPVPSVGAIDVTERILAQYGDAKRILVGHDPGNAADVSVLLKAYQLPGERRHHWWVVGEVTTMRDTTEAHIVALRRKLHEFGCNPGQDYGSPHIRTDPTTERAIYTQFRANGLDFRPAAYKTGTNKAATIPKESRIEAICRLLRNQAGESWLMVGANDRGAPVAPKTVESIELSERDTAYEAEKGRKGDGDITHWTTALGYALWSFERPRMEPEGGQRGRVNS